MAIAPPPKPQPKKSAVPVPKPRPSMGEGDSEPNAFIPPVARSQPSLLKDELGGRREASGEVLDFLSPFEVERRQKRWLMASVLVLSVGMTMSIPAVLLSLAAKPATKIVAVTPDLRVMQLPVLDQPYISDAAVGSWASGTVINTVSLGFAYYKQQLASVQSDYTPTAFANVYKSLNDNDLLPTMLADRFDISASLTSPPLIEAEGLVNDVYTWKISFPIILNLQNTDGSNPSRQYQVTVLVRRVSVAFNPRGVAIEQLVISQIQ